MESKMILRLIRMINWLRNLFEPKQVKRKYTKITDEVKRNMVTDFMSNKMTKRNISRKYNTSYSYTCKVINDSRGV